MRFRGAWWLIASALVVAGCGGNNNVTTSTTTLAVSSVTPAAGSTGVAVTAPVTATFNEVMNATTFNSTTFTLKAGSAPAVTGNISYSAGSSMATFTPASPLAYNTLYTATITTGVQNTSGTALGASDTWTFTTATGPAPTVTTFTPSNGSTGVPAKTTVTATFSEAMSASTITASTFTLTPKGGAAVAATVSYNATTFTATLTPNAPLAASTIYTATVTTGAVAATGSAIANANSCSFTTAAGPVPTVTSVAPTSAATGVAITSTVAATFSQAMDPSTITAATFMLSGGGTSVTGTFTADPTNTIFTFTPSAPLAYNTTYTALITTGALASSTTLPEVPLAADYAWSFTTALPPPATVTAVTPTSGSTGVATTGTTVTATFGAAMTASTINPATFTLTGPGGAVAGAVSYNSTSFVATFTPSVSLANGATYTATISTGATSALGAALAAPYTWNFTTVKNAVPTVTATVPASSATNVNTGSAVTATFSGPMNATTLTASTFTLTASGSPVAGAVTYDTGATAATFTPTAALAPNTTFTATITTGAQSSSGVALASNYTWTFTTGASALAEAVSFGTTYQTISGFGGATAWLGTLTPAQATALFSQTNGLGLSILRMRIDPEGVAAGGGAYGYPFETTQWDQELANANEAFAANPNALVIATPWTQPGIWKLSGSSSISDDGQTFNEAFASSCGSEGAAFCGGYLDPTHYGDYANYLEDFVTFFNNKSTTKLYAISMQNEPEENVTYESTVWTPEQMDSFVASLTAGGAKNPITTKLIMPEAEGFQSIQAQATLNDPNAVGNVSIVAGHLYGTTLANFYQTLAETLKKPVWMTEHFIALPTGETASTMSDALNMAEEIHNSLVVGQYSAYVWWWIWNDTCDSTGHYGLIDSGGGQTANGCYTSANPQATYYGDAIGQWSKFIQPGYVRASATASPTSGVYVSAYTGIDSTQTQHYVIVAINANTTAQNLNFTVSDAGSTISSLTPYSTTSAGGLVSQPAVTVTGGQFYYTLPAQSIVTLVQ